MIALRAVTQPAGRSTWAGARVEGVRLLLAIIGWIVASFAVGFASATLLPALVPGWAGDISRLSAVIVAEVYALLVIALVVGMAGLAGTQARLRVFRPSARALGLTVALWLGAYLVAFTLHAVLSALRPGVASPVELDRFLAFLGTDMGRLDGADVATWLVVVLRACLLAPLAEELLFRGALFGWLRGHLPAWPTILATALAFAAIHGLAPIMVPLAVVVGIAAGYARERAGSVTPLILAHLIQNVVVEVAGAGSLL